MDLLKIVPLLLYCWCQSATAQPIGWLWAQSGNGAEYDEAKAVTTDASGNVIVVGYFASDAITFGNITLTNNTPGFDDLFVVKYDPAGNVLWARSIGGDFDDKAFAVATDADGNIHVAGNFYSTSITVGNYTFTNAGAVGDIVLVKYDPDGAVLWATREGAAGLEIPYAIAVDDAGNFTVAGRFSSNSVTFGTTTLQQAGSMDVFVVKYDAAGTVLWAQGAGGGSNDEAYALAVRGDGDLIVAGYYTQEADFGSITLPSPGQANIFLARCDATTGSFLWATAVGSDGDERALAIALDAADNIYAAGYFQSSSLDFGSTTLLSTATDNGFVARFTAAGAPVWAQGLNGRSKVQGIAVSNNAVHACGTFRNDPLTYANDVLPLSGAADLFLLRSDLDGNAQWATKQTADGESGEIANALAADGQGRLVIAGGFDSDLLTFGNTQLAVSDGYDMFVIHSTDPGSGFPEAPGTVAITLFPNPVASTLTVRADRTLRDAHIAVMDAVGRTVMQRNMPGTVLELDLGALANGPYVVLHATPNATFAQRVVVHR